MNQRISVRALVEQDNKTLLVRRSSGRETILGLYELPGGRLAYGEQPEDALRRYLHDDIGLHIDQAKLFDVVTYIDHDDRDIQYAVITYRVELAGNHHDIKLSNNYDQHVWQLMRDVQQSTLTDLTQLLLGIIQQEQITDKSLEKISQNDDDETSKNKGDDKVTSHTDAVIYADGGSRGNPGPSACGFVILDLAQRIMARGGEYLGITTNNQAEYQGVRLALEKAQEIGLKNIDVRLDSMLVVNQMNGVYMIKNRELWPINERIRDLMSEFDRVTFRHVPRELNQLADGEVNKALDSHAGN